LVVETGKHPHIIKVWDVPDPPVSDEAAAEFRAAIIARYRSAAEIDAAIEARQRSLLGGRSIVSSVGRNGRAVPRRHISRDPAVVLTEQLETLVWSDENALRQYLRGVAQLSTTARRPVLDQLAVRSGRPRSYFSRLLRSACGNGVAPSNAAIQASTARH
jgi:hypothetical protein